MTANLAITTKIDVLRALLWQDAASYRKVIKSLLQARQKWYDDNVSGFWDNWFAMVFNLPGVTQKTGMLDDSALNDFGCAVWASVFGIDFGIPSISSSQISFGFRSNFYRKNFIVPGPNINFPTLQEKRLILRLRYMSLTSNGNIFDINPRMLVITVTTGFGSIYMKPKVVSGAVISNQIEYHFSWQPSANLLYILRKYSVLPTPATAQATLFYNGTPL